MLKNTGGIVSERKFWESCDLDIWPLDPRMYAYLPVYNHPASMYEIWKLYVDKQIQRIVVPRFWGSNCLGTDHYDLIPVIVLSANY